MNSTLLLKDKTETVELDVSNVPRVTLPKRDAIADCACDRWGHPYAARRASLNGPKPPLWMDRDF